MVVRSSLLADKVTSERYLPETKKRRKRYENELIL